MAATYCIDTCIVIDLFSRYPADTFVSLVENLREDVEAESLMSIGPVLDELHQGRKHSDSDIEDLLDRPIVDFFLPFDQDATDELLNITHSASAYRRKRKTKKNADPYLVAYCRAHACVLITNDQQLADAARTDGVSAMTFVEYVQQRGWTF